MQTIKFDDLKCQKYETHKCTDRSTDDGRSAGDTDEWTDGQHEEYNNTTECRSHEKIE